MNKALSQNQRGQFLRGLCDQQMDAVESDPSDSEDLVCLEGGSSGLLRGEDFRAGVAKRM